MPENAQIENVSCKKLMSKLCSLHWKIKFQMWNYRYTWLFQDLTPMTNDCPLVKNCRLNEVKICYLGAGLVVQRLGAPLAWGSPDRSFCLFLCKFQIDLITVVFWYVLISSKTRPPLATVFIFFLAIHRTLSFIWTLRLFYPILREKRLYWNSNGNFCIHWLFIFWESCHFYDVSIPIQDMVCLIFVHILFYSFNKIL